MDTLEIKDSPTWSEVEQKITNEIIWLDKTISTFGKKEPARFAVTCKRCLLREIAILIITGAVQAKEINLKPPGVSFWLPTESAKRVYHGRDWHSNKMVEIESHFRHLGFTVVREPYLSLGRADLGVYMDGAMPLFIEVGTTSIFKLLTNLKSIKNAKILLVPSDTKIIEFEM